MATTTIKVPVELRDRLAQRAQREHTTLAGAIESSLDAADAEDFWSEVARTMSTPQARRQVTAEAKRLEPTLHDGLEAEDWSDVLASG